MEWWSACIAPAIAVLLLVPGFALIGLVVALIVLAALVVAVAAALVATPWLIVGYLRRRWRALSATERRPALPAALDQHAKRT